MSYVMMPAMLRVTKYVFYLFKKIFPPIYCIFFINAAYRWMMFDTVIYLFNNTTYTISNQY